MAASSLRVSSRLASRSRGSTPAIGRSSKVIATSRAGVCALIVLTAIAKILNLKLLNIPVVLLEGARELVRPVVAADEVQVVGGGRMHGGFERGAAGRGDRSGRQARIAIGVIG